MEWFVKCQTSPDAPVHLVSLPEGDARALRSYVDHGTIPSPLAIGPCLPRGGLVDFLREQPMHSEPAARLRVAANWIDRIGLPVRIEDSFIVKK